MGKLYLIATPIGNMEDITLRAIRILNEVDFLACEDTRRTGLLFQKIKNTYELLYFKKEKLLPKKPIFISFYEENEQKRIPQIIKILKEDKNVGLVSNAGTPIISDPGFKLVREAINQGIEVISIPGASSILTALTSSGLPTDKFLYLGYLPKKQGKRKKLLNSLYQSNYESIDHLTIIFFESPYRLIKTLVDLNDVFGNIQIVICRELTKVYEEIRREKINQAIKYYSNNPPQGEFTIVFSIPLK